LDSAPEGVQAIAERFDGRTMVHTGGEFYQWELEPTLREAARQGWSACSSALSWPTSNVKKSGDLMDTEEFKTLRAEAIEWVMDDG